MAEYSNLYNPRIPFNDNLSHFLRMDKTAVEEYFSPTGPLARINGIPNWVERASDGNYELVTLDANNEVCNRWGFFIYIKPKEVASYEPGKGKAVATWDYSISVPNADEDFSFKIYSQDALKYIFAYPGGTVSAIPPRMRQVNGQISTLKFATKDYSVPLMPYVNLAFFMWLEETPEQSNAYATMTWLIQNMEGWRDSLQA